MIDLNWYSTLFKPALTPPALVFAPAWIFLYITILASLVLYIVKKSRKTKAIGYTYFAMQMIFNILWTPAFFVLHDLTLATIIVVVMDILILLNIIEFYKVSKFAGIILIPYFLWSIFATYLTIGILLLN